MDKHKNRKHSWTPYTSDIQRFSVYPQIQKPREDTIQTGSVVTLDISGVDDKGNGIAVYKNIKVIVKNASLGSRVQAKITRVGDGIAIAEVVRVLKDSYVEY
ncbi:TRAM domain-containing protein [Thermogladius sp. 4427co]|uniref:TRAM domain-containing protein n=1 Tax=Thermogladius sp. 4427co TaxID=3450718 RepID=UPI003F78BBE8